MSGVFCCHSLGLRLKAQSLTKRHNYAGSLHWLHGEWASVCSPPGRLSGLAGPGCPPSWHQPSHPWPKTGLRQLRDKVRLVRMQLKMVAEVYWQCNDTMTNLFYSGLLLARNFKKVFQVLLSRDKWLDLNMPSPLPSILAKQLEFEKNSWDIFF